MLKEVIGKPLVVCHRILYFDIFNACIPQRVGQVHGLGHGSREVFIATAWSHDEDQCGSGRNTS